MKPLFLVGYMAAGKTTLGRRAAQLLNVEFIDLDAYIESRYRKRISDLFAERGEEGFRDIERRMLHEVAEFDNVLVATGGGTPCFFDNMEYMRHRGVTIYLAASVQTLCRRLSHAKVKRPLVAGKTPEELYEYMDLGALGCRYEDEHPGVFIGSDYVQYPPQKQEMKMK